MLGRIPSLTGNRGDLTSPPDISATRADDGIGELIGFALGEAGAQVLHHLAMAGSPDAWIEAVTASGIPELNRFTSGLLADEAAVRAGLTLVWSNGQVEGDVNRLKLIERQMYGRANFDLLRQRVRHAA